METKTRYKEVKEGMEPYLKKLLADLRSAGFDISKNCPIGFVREEAMYTVECYMKEGTWGDAFTLQAIRNWLADVMGGCVEVYRSRITGGKTYIETYEPQNCDENVHIRIFLSDSHYNSLYLEAESPDVPKGGTQETLHTFAPQGDAVSSFDELKTYIPVYPDLSEIPKPPIATDTATSIPEPPIATATWSDSESEVGTDTTSPNSESEVGTDDTTESVVTTQYQYAAADVPCADAIDTGFTGLSMKELANKNDKILRIVLADREPLCVPHSRILTAITQDFLYSSVFTGYMNYVTEQHDETADIPKINTIAELCSPRHTLVEIQSGKVVAKYSFAIPGTDTVITYNSLCKLVEMVTGAPDGTPSIDINLVVFGKYLLSDVLARSESERTVYTIVGTEKDSAQFFDNVAIEDHQRVLNSHIGLIHSEVDIGRFITSTESMKWVSKYKGLGKHISGVISYKADVIIETKKEQVKVSEFYENRLSMPKKLLDRFDFVCDLVIEVTGVCTMYLGEEDFTPRPYDSGVYGSVATLLSPEQRKSISRYTKALIVGAELDSRVLLSQCKIASLSIKLPRATCIVAHNVCVIPSAELLYLTATNTADLAFTLVGTYPKMEILCIASDASEPSQQPVVFNNYFENKLYLPKLYMLVAIGVIFTYTKMPEYTLQLTRVKHVYLSDCIVYPNCISACEELTVIGLQNISNIELPSKADELSIVRIQNTRIARDFPDYPNMYILDIVSSGTIVFPSGGMSHLRFLNANDTKCTFPDSFERLIWLSCVNCDLNRVPECKKLEHLDCSRNSGIKQLPISLSNLVSLKAAECSLITVPSYPKLQKISVPYNKLTALPRGNKLIKVDARANKIACLKGTGYDLGYNVIEEFDISMNPTLKDIDLERFSSLRTLDVSYTGIEGRIGGISKLKKLVSLNVSGLKHLTSLALPISLKTLNVSYTDNIVELMRGYINNNKIRLGNFIASKDYLDSISKSTKIMGIQKKQITTTPDEFKSEVFHNVPYKVDCIPSEPSEPATKSGANSFDYRQLLTLV